MLCCAFAVAIAIVAAPRGAAGQAPTLPPTAYPTKIFAAVDAVSLIATYVVVTGVVQGDAAPSSWKIMYSGAGAGEASAWAAMCQRSALLAMSKPGQYLLEIGMPGTYTAPVCTLTRVAP